MEFDVTGRSIVRPDRQVAIIAAVAKNGVIGADNRVPWHLPEDLRRFREVTSGHAIIMGRKTWESIGTALPNRQNIVVSRQPMYSSEGIETAESLPKAYEIATRPNPIFVIGGEFFFKEALNVARTVYLTEIDMDFAGDVFFPKLDPKTWVENRRQINRYEGRQDFRFDFVEYRRRVFSSD
ncbi:dihydrofolate reductase [Bradyrhizobium sp. RT11b]|uniref:dihydrofolate reductase n=1 Tax=Bradyrhizobium sp. RT11b TaxID=3156332 RepID=UPI00339AB8E7